MGLGRPRLQGQATHTEAVRLLAWKSRGFQHTLLIKAVVGAEIKEFAALF